MTRAITPARRAGRAPMRKKRNKWTPKRTEVFFAVLAESCNVTKAAETVEMSVSSAYIRKQRDAAFMAGWREALYAGYSQVELAAIRRAIEGTETRTVQKGPDGKQQYERIVESFDGRTAIHLLRLHREEVEMVRRSQEEHAEMAQGIGRARAVLDEIRSRIPDAPRLSDAAARLDDD